MLHEHANCHLDDDAWKLDSDPPCIMHWRKVAHSLRSIVKGGHYLEGVFLDDMQQVGQVAKLLRSGSVKLNSRNP